MTPIAEVFAREDENSNCIYLYPEGVFYKAYLRSAFLFIRDFGNFKPIKKQLRSVERELVSIGFPKSTIDKYFPEDALTAYNDGALSAQCAPIDLEAYQTWFDSLPRFERPEPAASIVKTGGRNQHKVTAPIAPNASESPSAALRQPLRKIDPQIARFSVRHLHAHPVRAFRGFPPKRTRHRDGRWQFTITCRSSKRRTIC